MDAGKLKERVTFTLQTETVDADFGGVAASDGEQIATRAHFRYLKNGESVMANRLAGRATIVATIRANAATRQLTPSAKMRDDETGWQFNVKGVTPLDDLQWLEVLVEGGPVT